MVQSERNADGTDEQRRGDRLGYDHIPCSGCGAAIGPGDDCKISASGRAYCNEGCIRR